MAFLFTMFPMFCEGGGVLKKIVLSGEQYGRGSSVCRFLLTAHLALGRLLSGKTARFHKNKCPLKTKSDVY